MKRVVTSTGSTVNSLLIYPNVKERASKAGHFNRAQDLEEFSLPQVSMEAYCQEDVRSISACLNSTSRMKAVM